MKLALIVTVATLTLLVLGAPNPLPTSQSVAARHLIRRDGSVWDDLQLASDEDYERHECMGGLFLAACSKPDNEAKGFYTPDRQNFQSPWQGDLKDSLATWGWSEIDRKDEYDKTLSREMWGPHWGRAMDELNIGIADSDNKFYFFLHQEMGDDAPELEDQIYAVKGKYYPKTGAYIKFNVQPSAGAIFVKNVIAPLHAAEDEDLDIPNDLLPELRAVSDMLWSGWYRANEKDRFHINYFFTMWTTNLEITEMLKRLLAEQDIAQAKPWPGTDFKTNTKEGAALLGCPLAKAFSYFLIQHKPILGIRYISNIKAFVGDDKTNTPMIMFEVKQGLPPPRI